MGRTSPGAKPEALSGGFYHMRRWRAGAEMPAVGSAAAAVSYAVGVLLARLT